MTQTKRKRTATRASTAGATKRRRQTRKAATSSRGTKQQRAAQDRASSRSTSLRGIKRIEDDESTRRSRVGVDEPEESVESVGGRGSRGSQVEEGVEEIDERSRLPGGTGDSSFGDADEGH
jgi:hypothetical protein